MIFFKTDAIKCLYRWTTSAVLSVILFRLSFC